uniref:Uncharacterized protein n=1 Tax=Attheya septentrionalis TaxID=420275 RepID=A0A7S2UF97_9STRA
MSLSDTDAAVQNGVSRIETLRTLLAKHGAPGSRGCRQGAGDLTPIIRDGDVDVDVEPELVQVLGGEHELMLDLHPHLFPLARSQSTGNYVCALRRAFANDADYESSSMAPWPIVESKINAPGMRLLSLNSEHFMRRIACEADDSGTGEEIVAIYNEGLGQGKLPDAGLDEPYEPGSVAKLGYGVDKYALLRVGPFPDLYESMALQHQAKGDESSSLIAAETANGKFTGFGSTFAFYAKLLSTFPNRQEETKDAARVCLRIPIPSGGMEVEDLAQIARFARLATEDDSPTEAIAKMAVMYETIRQHEQDDDAANASKTPEQNAIDEANFLLDSVALHGGRWSDIRSKLGIIYHSAGRDDMALFVDPGMKL